MSGPTFIRPESEAALAIEADRFFGFVRAICESNGGPRDGGPQSQSEAYNLAASALMSHGAREGHDPDAMLAGFGTALGTGFGQAEPHTARVGLLRLGMYVSQGERIERASRERQRPE